MGKLVVSTSILTLTRDADKRNTGVENLLLPNASGMAVYMLNRYHLVYLHLFLETSRRAAQLCNYESTTMNKNNIHLVTLMAVSREQFPLIFCNILVFISCMYLPLLRNPMINFTHYLCIEGVFFLHNTWN